MYESKNLLILYASPHKLSYTGKLLNKVLECLPEELKISGYSVFDMLPHACNDCGYCKKNIGCKFSDLDKFFHDFENADYVILATPIYNLSVPAPFKSIIDRFQRYYNMRFSINIKHTITKPKNAMLLMCSGSNDTRGFEIVKEQLKQSFSVMNTKLIEVVCCSNTDNECQFYDSDFQIDVKVKKFLKQIGFGGERLYE